MQNHPQSKRETKSCQGGQILWTGRRGAVRHGGYTNPAIRGSRQRGYSRVKSGSYVIYLTKLDVVKILPRQRRATAGPRASRVISVRSADPELPSGSDPVARRRRTPRLPWPVA